MRFIISDGRISSSSPTSLLVLGRQWLAADLLGFVGVLFGRLWIGLQVSPVKTAKHKQTLCDHTWPLVVSAKGLNTE